MITTIKKLKSIQQNYLSNQNIICIYNEKSDYHKLLLTSEELKYLKKQLKDEKEIISINQLNRFIHFVNIKEEKNINKYAENCRMIGDKLLLLVRDNENIQLVFDEYYKEQGLLITEGLALSNYTFTKHKTNQKPNKLKTINISHITDNEIIELQNILDAVYFTRDLINEPFSHLKAKDLADAAISCGKQNNIEVTILNKKKIEDLKMGGLLAVNKGSIDDPNFIIMQWKPKNASNKKPIVLVGKGIVYDTGGLSLKPTTNSMDLMKIDMGGAGTVIGTMQAIASNKVNKYVIGLVPATDNRPSGNAYAPGDVITMYDGTSVEVLNTDAEGRIILADALSFAKQYNPELVIDLATLTGAAVAAIGHYGFVSMHDGAEKDHTNLKLIGDQVHERLAEFPFWDDYDELIKSEIADIKNIGGAYGGAITAGKFLAHFADYPFIHIDLPAVYSKEKYGYRGKGATGMGVRLLYKFIKNRA